jgi:hypothetical protein
MEGKRLVWRVCGCRWEYGGGQARNFGLCFFDRRWGCFLEYEEARDCFTLDDGKRVYRSCARCERSTLAPFELCLLLNSLDLFQKPPLSFLTTNQQLPLRKTTSIMQGQNILTFVSTSFAGLSKMVNSGSFIVQLPIWSRIHSQKPFHP